MWEPMGLGTSLAESKRWPAPASSGHLPRVRLLSGPEEALMSGGRGHFLGRPSVCQLPVRSQGARSLNSHGVVWETSQQ